MSYLPGEIYRVDLPPAGEHLFVIVSREELNRGRQVLAAMITSSRFALRSRLANCVPLRAGDFGLSQNCVIQCENVVSIEADALLGDPVARLDEETIRTMIKALGFVFAADCEPM